VCDRLAARHLAFRALDIDVDPLMITRRLGKLVDHRLIDEHPFAGAELLADVGLHVGRRVHFQHRRFLRSGGDYAAPGSACRPLADTPRRVRASPSMRGLQP
jgi:hypothetical protein